MKKFIKRNAKHFIIWILLLIYLLSANTIYVNKFLVHGKPMGRDPELVAHSESFQFDLNSLDPIIHDGADLYMLWGYAFVKTNPDVENQIIKLVLHSVKEDLVYQTEVLPRPDITKAFPDYKKNLDNTGFKVLIAREALRIQNYQIGILIEDKQGNPLYYHLTGKYIKRSPNTMRLIGEP